MIISQMSFFVQNIQFRNEMQDQVDELNILQRMTTTEGWKTYSNLSSLGSSRYIYDQSTQNPVPLQDPDTSHPGTALIKPLEIRGQTIGALGISADSDQELTDEEKMLLESVSSEVAEALERARLFETSQRSAAELAVLNEMGNSLSQAQNEEAILENIYTYTAKLMETPQFYVAIYNRGDETISFPYVNMHGVQVTEDHPDATQWLPRPVGTGLTGHIIKNQQPILLDSQAEEKLAEMGLPFLRFGNETQSWLGVPMIIGRTVLGVISVQSEEVPNLYNQHHLDLLTTIAYQAAIAINNTRLLSQQQLRAEQEHLVRTVTDKVRRGTDAASIMRVALEELSTILDADISAIQLGSKDNLLSQKEIEPPTNSNPNGQKNQ
jgi:GAF domain-containing protein